MLQKENTLISQLPYLLPSSRDEVKGNERYMASILVKINRKEGMYLEFCVLYLIHHSIHPDYEDYEKVEMFSKGDPYRYWNVSYEYSEVSELVLIVPHVHTSSRMFKLLEAHYLTRVVKKEVEVYVPISRIQALRFVKK